jgi:hypothetical protein
MAKINVAPASDVGLVPPQSGSVVRIADINVIGANDVEVSHHNQLRVWWVYTMITKRRMRDTERVYKRWKRCSTKLWHNHNPVHTERQPGQGRGPWKRGSFPSIQSPWSNSTFLWMATTGSMMTTTTPTWCVPLTATCELYWSKWKLWLDGLVALEVSLLYISNPVPAGITDGEAMATNMWTKTGRTLFRLCCMYLNSLKVEVCYVTIRRGIADVAVTQKHAYTSDTPEYIGFTIDTP